MAKNPNRAARRTAYVLLASAIVVAVTYVRTPPFDPQGEQAAAVEQARKNPPPPGSEAALRRMIDALRDGKPDYASMSKSLADQTRRLLPREKEFLTGFGAPQTVTYMGSRTPWTGGPRQEHYRIKFQHQDTLWSIAFDGNATIQNWTVSPYGPPPPGDIIRQYGGRPWRDQLGRLGVQTALVLIAAALGRFVLRIRL